MLLTAGRKEKFLEIIVFEWSSQEADVEINLRFSLGDFI